jgi:hypothetical protein
MPNNTIDIDDTEFLEFFEALELFEKKFPKESKKALGKVGNEVKKIIKREAKNNVKKVSGNYLKSIKKGRVWEEGGRFTVRVFPRYKTAPHAWLIENGHRIVTKDGKEIGYVPGKKIFERANREIERNFERIVEEEVLKELDKI